MEDTEEALKLDEKNVKAYYRAARALSGLHKYPVRYLIFVYYLRILVYLVCILVYFVYNFRRLVYLLVEKNVKAYYRAARALSGLHKYNVRYLDPPNI